MANLTLDKGVLVPCPVMGKLSGLNKLNMRQLDCWGPASGSVELPTALGWEEAREGLLRDRPDPAENTWYGISKHTSFYFLPFLGFCHRVCTFARDGERESKKLAMPGTSS